MEPIAAVLHSSYAYLLIFQIILVAALSLTLLSLIVRRIKSVSMNAEPGATGVASGSSEIVGELAELRAQHEELLAKNAELSNVKTEAEQASVGTLQDKIKYLEAKLLEYEILQEEIGSLSALKIENEKLKETVLRLQKNEIAAADTTAISTGA